MNRIDLRYITSVVCVVQGGARQSCCGLHDTTMMRDVFLCGKICYPNLNSHRNTRGVRCENHDSQFKWNSLCASKGFF